MASQRLRRPRAHAATCCPPQAELATSHKCLSHEVKRLTEENQGLRAEQPPPLGLVGLEQDESTEAALPSSVQVSGERLTLATLGDRPRLPGVTGSLI